MANLITDWSTSAASNNDTPPDGFPEGMNYTQVNDSARELMAVIVRWVKDNNGVLASAGSANAYTLTPNATYSSYFTGMTFTFRASFANTGAATLNVGGLGAKSLKRVDTSALEAGDIPQGSAVQVVYDGTQFQVVNVMLSASALLTLIKTVDGAGSGLDADTLDGSSSAAFQAALGFTPVEQGGGSGMSTNKVRIGWSGSQLLAQVDSVPQGALAFADDYGTMAERDVTISTSSPSGGANGDVWLKYTA